MSGSGKKQRRIVFGARCFADASSTLSMAINLAKFIDGKIEAYLLEEEAIACFAAHPSARTISIGASSSAPVTVESMQRAFQRDAAVFEQALSLAAHNATIDWSFKKLDGSIRSLLREKNTRAADYVLFGYQKLGRQIGSGILVVQGLDEADNQLMDMAGYIASPMHLGIDTIQISDEGKPNQENEPSIMTKPGALDFIEKNSFATVITSTGIAEQIGLDALVNACRCPVLVLNR